MKIPAKKRTALELLVAVLWCLVTLGTDRLFFKYDWKTPAFFVYKALFVLLAFLLVHGIVTLVQKVRAGNSFARRWLAWTLPYLAVNLVVLLIVWPGIWGNDDLAVLSLARTLQPNSWQHFLTSGAFILSLMFVPMPGGVVLVQNLLISAIVGCFAAAAQDLTEKRLGHAVKPAWFAIVYLPFLLPPVVMHTQQPFRTTWSGWTELFLVFMLVAMYLRGTKLNKKELCAIVVLGTLAASWRSECVYYLAAIPVLLLVMCARKLLRPTAVAAATVLVFAGYLACSRYTSTLMGEAWQYKMIALCYQTASLVQDADPVADADELAAIDRVFDVTYCRENSNIHGPEMRTNMTRETGVTEEDWSACQKAFFKLALKYPKSLLRERLGMFRATMQADYGGSRQKDFFGFAYVCYDLDGYYLTSIERAGKIAYQSPLAFPINQDLRKAVIGTMVYDTETPLGKLISTTWFMLPPLLLLFVEALVLAVRKKWFLFLVTGTLCLRVVLVFLTAPDSFFMYYLTPYIAGYAIAAAGVVYEVMRRKLKVERNPG